MHPSVPVSTAAFARRFRLLMGYHNFTLRDIASATNNAVSTVGAWKNGRVPTETQTLKRLAGVFQVSVEYLLEGCDSNWPGRPARLADDAAGRILEDLDILQWALKSESSRRASEPTVKERERCGRVKA